MLDVVGRGLPFAINFAHTHVRSSDMTGSSASTGTFMLPRKWHKQSHVVYQEQNDKRCERNLSLVGSTFRRSFMLFEFKICGVLAWRVALAKPMTVAVVNGIFSFAIQQRHSLDKCYCKREIESYWCLCIQY